MKKTYDRIAPVYDLLDAPYEKLWKSRLRKIVFQDLSGDILDAGAGTGCNIAAYPAHARVTAVDVSDVMLARARARAASLGKPVTFQTEDLTSLSFANETFDSVVATFVFMCMTQDDQPAALKEIARVCRRGGEVRLVDYAMSEKPVVRAGMRIMAPWLKTVFHGSYATSLEEHFSSVGLTIADERMIFGDVVKMTVLRRT